MVVVDAAETGLDALVVEGARRPRRAVVAAAADEQAANHAEQAERQVAGEPEDQCQPRRALVVFLLVVVLLDHGDAVVLVQRLVLVVLDGPRPAMTRPSGRTAGTSSCFVVLDRGRPDEAAGEEHEADGGGGDDERR